MEETSSMELVQNELSDLNNSEQNNNVQHYLKGNQDINVNLNNNKSHTLRFLIVTQTAGALIGKGGERIRFFSQKFNIELHIPHTRTPLRVVVLSGNRESLLASLLEIIPLLKIPPIEAYDKKQFQLNLLVPDFFAPIIIGTKGNRISALRKESECYIKIFDYNLPNSTERLIIMSGDLNNIITAITTIITYFENNAQRKFPIHFNPANITINDLLVQFRDMPPKEQKNMYYHVQNRDNRFNPYPTIQYTPPPQPPIINNHMANHNIPYNNNDPTIIVRSTQVSIPGKFLYHLINANRNHLRYIKNITGCHIEIDQAIPGCELRVITLTGTDRQINDAEFYMQERIRQEESHRNIRR